MKYCVSTILFLMSTSLFGQQHSINRYPQIYFDRGVELFDEGRFNAAILQFEKAIQSDDYQNDNGDILFYHAMAKLYAGHENAEPFLSSYLSNNPNTARVNQANIALGDYFYDKGQYPAALGYYRDVDEKALDTDKRGQFNFRIGFCYVFREKYSEAKGYLEKSIKNPGKYQDMSQYYYGYACLMEKDYENAFTAFRAIKDDKFEKVHFYMAQVLYQLSRYEESLQELDKLNTRKVKKEEISWLRAKNYYRMKAYAKASEAFTAGKPNIDKVAPQDQFEIGYSFAKSDQLLESIPWYRAVAKNNDSLAQLASYELGNVLLKLKNYREASYAYSEVWRTGYNEEIAKIALYTQAKIAVQLGDANSTKLLDKYIRLFPKSPDAKEASKLKARLLLNTDKYREAVEILEGMDDLDEQTEEICQKVTLARGMELYKSRSWKEASDLFGKCKVKKANLKYAAEAAYWQAEVTSQEGNTNMALSQFKQFIDMPQSNNVDVFAYAYYAVGYIYFQQKDYKNATIYFEEFTTKVTRVRYEERLVHDAYLRLGDCNLMNRDLDKSVRAYAYVSAKNGNDADYALYQSGLIYGLLEQPEEKVSTLKRLIEQYPKSRYTIDAYNDVASEYMISKRYSEAEKMYKRILEMYPGTQNTSKAYSTLGRIYYNDKRIDEAIGAYTKLYDEFKGGNDAATAAEMVKTIYTDEGRAKDYVKWAAVRGGITATQEDSVMFETAMNAYDRDDYVKAANSFESYLTEKPNGNFVISSQYYLAMSYEQAKQPQKAIEYYKKVAVANSGDMKEDATLAVLKIYGADAKCEEILTYVEILEEITRSKDIQRKAWKTMMYCYNKMNNEQGLQKIASKVIDDQSADNDMKFESRLILAKQTISKGNTEESLKVLKSLYTGNDNRFAAEAKYLEAKLLFDTDSTNLCKESCYELLDQFNGYDLWVGKGLLLLGDAFAKEKDVFNAKVTWNTIVENFSDAKLVAEAKSKIKQAEIAEKEGK